MIQFSITPGTRQNTSSSANVANNVMLSNEAAARGGVTGGAYSGRSKPLSDVIDDSVNIDQRNKPDPFINQRYKQSAPIAYSNNNTDSELPCTSTHRVY